MQFLIIILIIAVIFLIYMFLEASFIKVDKVKYTKNKKNIKIVQLSDIHINLCRISSKRVNNKLKEINPDLVVITGDYVLKPNHAEKFISFLKEISGSFPVYMVLGNHDYKAFSKDKTGFEKFKDNIRNTGAVLLENKSISFAKNGKLYNFIGLNDIRLKLHNFEEACSSADKNANTNIVLCHNPDIIFELSKEFVDYVFSGHFHGGQIWAPFHFEFKILRNEKLCKMGVYRGAKKINGIRLYINRGLGNVIVPMRFLSPPEITVFYIP